MNQFRTIERIMQDFQEENCQELPAIPKDGIIRNEEGRPIGYIDEDGTIKMPRRGERPWKEFFETL